jgi:hypothetical protein
MINPDLMREAAISEYMESFMLNDAHKCAALMRLCDTMENIGRIREIQESIKRKGYSAPTLPAIAQMNRLPALHPAG